MIPTTTVMIRIIIIVIIIINNCYQLDYMQVRRPKEVRARRCRLCGKAPESVAHIIIEALEVGGGRGGGLSREMGTTMHDIVGSRSKEVLK